MAEKGGWSPSSVTFYSDGTIQSYTLTQGIWTN